MLTAKLRQWIVVYDPTSEQRLLMEGDEQRDELVQEVGKLLKVLTACFSTVYNIR